MNKLQIFEHFRFGKIRSTIIDGAIWFAAADVCHALEIKNHRDALLRLDADEKGVGLTDTSTGEKTISIVNEQGLYALVLSSRKREAKEFKRWITHDVIPAIRKTGNYSVTGQEQSLAISPKDMKALAKAVAKELQSQEVKALPLKRHCIYTEEVNAYKLRFMEEAVRGMEQLDSEKCSVVCSFISGLLAGIKKKALRLAGML